MADEEEQDCCPLCMEELDITDKTFDACPCGYQVRTCALPLSFAFCWFPPCVAPPPAPHARVCVSPLLPLALCQLRLCARMRVLRLLHLHTKGREKK